MVHEELLARLNEAGYKNWLKAGYCLLRVKEGLCEFMDQEMRTFHKTVIKNNTALQRGQTCRYNCRPKANQFQSACPVCDEWRNEILRHHTKPYGIINWGNCKPWLWPTEPWELAKAFMPRGHADKYRAEQCDAAALLNVLHLCDHFHFINQALVTQVIHCRNELMHSCEMQVSDQWMGRFQKSLQELIRHLHHIPAMNAASQQIHEMLSVDLSLNFPGVDSVDGEDTEEVEIESLSQWETELLRESIKEQLDNDEHEGRPVDLKKLQTLHRFLRGHKDLEKQFRTELDSIEVLEEQMQKSFNKER
ncbi:uncharacterized protein CXorf38 homolog [Hoplias malabaricus]|uniref:uncharacterized protein CXorf38 homolog n=1 Tax=Hoplias malabaricus TaxID=27720 RepID=UPI0034620FBF